MNYSLFIRFAVLPLIILSLSACSLFRASPSKKKLFLSKPDLQIEQRDRAPFNGVAYLNAVKVDQMHETCKKLVFLPVRTDLLEKELAKEISDPKKLEQRIEEAQEIASYFHERLVAAAKAYENYPYTILDKPEPDSFIVEFALVELEPTSVSVNAFGAVLGYFVPGGGLIGRAASGAIAFEAQIRDGSTNEILIEFRDREKDKTSPFSLKDFQEYAHIRRSIDEWAEQYAELSATARHHRVADSFPITLNPI